MRNLLFIFAALALSSCDTEKLFEGPNAYSDDFESYDNVDQMIEGDDEFWSFVQITYDNNRITIDTSFGRNAGSCVKFQADKTENGSASKASIVKQQMAFWENETLVVTAWYYLPGAKPSQWLFIMDIEEQAAIGAGPGMRLAIVDEQLLVEHKYLNPNLTQSGDGVIFPRDEWVKVTFEAKLHQKKKGYVKVYQNDQLIIEQQDWNTLPKDILYAQQGTKGMYSSVEFGLTANSFESDLTLYVDDVEVGLK